MSAIAIVGIGCQFADAPDLHAYWNMMLERRDGFTPVPPDRWNMEAFYSKNRRATDKSYTPSGGFIEDIRSFPALHFGIPPRRVEVMDPQQRFAIEMGLRAIQDAGYDPKDLPRMTGVFMGCTATEYRDILATRIAAQMMGDGMLGTAPEDPDVIASEEKHKLAAETEDDPETAGTEGHAVKKRPQHALKLRCCGVRCDYLLALTFALNMWDWPTWKVVTIMMNTTIHSCVTVCSL